MRIKTASDLGFCFGVRNAVKLALDNAAENVYAYGQIIHNNEINERLRRAGVKIVESIDGISSGDKVIIRSHGASQEIHEGLKSRGAIIIDATCPYVAKIHRVVSEYYGKGYRIIIAGSKGHAEVIGINGWCDDSAIIVGSAAEAAAVCPEGRVCAVCQTTFSVQEWQEIQKKLTECNKTVEIFNTICYTTYNRQEEIRVLAASCDVVLVLGSASSSNTAKLQLAAAEVCKRTFRAENLDDVKKVKFLPTDIVGIAAGASTPDGLIKEVQKYMAKVAGNRPDAAEVSEEFAKGVEDTLVSYKKNARITATVISADAAGVKVRIGGKSDALIAPEEVNMDGSYDPGEFTEGAEVNVIILDTAKNDQGLITVSKKEVDRIKEGDKVVDGIRNSEEFSLGNFKDTKGGLIGKLGTYSVFVPASQIKTHYVTDLKPYVGKTLRLTAVSIDDEKHKIVASQRRIFEAERAAKEESFWSKMEPGVVVPGKVKRATEFGAFVSVDGFDCLARIADLAWYRVKTVEEILTIGETYEFVVLSADRAKGRVSLGYKQLQRHPFEIVTEKYPEGTTVDGTVVRLLQYGAFVNIEQGVDGLVHVSEAAHGFVKNINDVLKVGDKVQAKVTKIDYDAKKISLSIKALLPDVELVHIEDAEEEDVSEESKEVKGKDPKEAFEKKAAAARAPGKTKARKVSPADNGPREWSEETSNNPFADLLKNFTPEE